MVNGSPLEKNVPEFKDIPYIYTVYKCYKRSGPLFIRSRTVGLRCGSDWAGQVLEDRRDERATGIKGRRGGDPCYHTSCGSSRDTTRNPGCTGDALAEQWRASSRGGASFQRLLLRDLSCHTPFVKGGGTKRCAINTLGPNLDCGSLRFAVKFNRSVRKVTELSSFACRTADAMVPLFLATPAEREWPLAFGGGVQFTRSAFLPDIRVDLLGGKRHVSHIRTRIREISHIDMHTPNFMPPRRC
eukprot:848868-Prorocentrum_minimum.AAC.1